MLEAIHKQALLRLDEAKASSPLPGACYYTTTLVFCAHKMLFQVVHFLRRRALDGFEEDGF